MFGLSALPWDGLNMSACSHLLVALENVQSSPQEVEHGLGFLDEAWVFYGPHQLKRKAAMQRLLSIGHCVATVRFSTRSCLRRATCLSVEWFARAARPRFAQRAAVPVVRPTGKAR